MSQRRHPNWNFRAHSWLTYFCHLLLLLLLLLLCPQDNPIGTYQPARSRSQPRPPRHLNTAIHMCRGGRDWTWLNRGLSTVESPLGELSTFLWQYSWLHCALAVRCDHRNAGKGVRPDCLVICGQSCLGFQTVMPQWFPFSNDHPLLPWKLVVVEGGSMFEWVEYSIYTTHLLSKVGPSTVWRDEFFLLKGITVCTNIASTFGTWIGFLCLVWYFPSDLWYWLLTDIYIFCCCWDSF